MSDTVNQKSLCRICGNPTGRDFDASEMMFGMRTRHAYFECQACGCVQIKNIPENIGDYYPENYYSLSSQSLPSSSHLGEKEALSHRLKALAINSTRLTRSLFLTSPSTRAFLNARPVLKSFITKFSDPNFRILDVGSGSGEFLRCLDFLYYKYLLGIDPHVKESVNLHGRPFILRQPLAGLKGQFDVICLHHVLEHLPDQTAALDDLRQLLAKDGRVLIRIPIAQSRAYREYGEHWAQLDPPRHFFLHTLRSLEIITEKTGFEIVSIEYDSTSFQFWCSELYKRNIPLMELDNVSKFLSSFFNDSELAGYDQKTRDVNTAGEGDQIAVILRQRSISQVT